MLPPPPPLLPPEKLLLEGAEYELDDELLRTAPCPLLLETPLEITLGARLDPL